MQKSGVESKISSVEQQMRLMAMMQAGVLDDVDFEDGEEEEEEYYDEVDHAQQLLAHASKLI